MNPKIGAFEELILLAVGSLGERAYAVSVQQLIETAGEREAAMGAVYGALERLEKKGYVRSKLGPVTNRQGGKRKRFYQVTAAGHGALDQAQYTRQALIAAANTDLRPDLGGAS